VPAPPRAVTPAVWGALVTVYILWGSTYLAIREAIDTMPPFLMASVRFLVAGGLLYAVAVGRGDRVGDRPRWPQWRSAIVVGGLLLVGGNGGVVWSEQHIPSGVTALLVATIPLWMVVIGVAGFGERVRVQEAVGVAIGFAGIVLLVAGSPSTNGTGHLDLAGAGAALFAALCWATGSLYSRRAPLPSRPLVSTAMQMLAGGALLAVVGVASGELSDVHLSRISLSSTLGLAYLIVFGSLVAFSAYVWLLRNARISLIATYAYVNPIVAVFLGWAFLSEPIRGVTLLAGAVIVVAVALIVSARRPPSAARTPVGTAHQPDARVVPAPAASRAAASDDGAADDDDAA
jgi:drug/metabolite transporter (DMT)-like permease